MAVVAAVGAGTMGSKTGTCLGHVGGSGSNSGPGYGGGGGGTPALSYTGGGGGGGGGHSASGGTGGSGVVIISYQSVSQRGTGGSVTYYGITPAITWTHIFTASGTYIA